MGIKLKVQGDLQYYTNASTVVWNQLKKMTDLPWYSIIKGPSGT